MENREYDLYKDIQGRTNGEIYIGVVGPVRTGKSTFIKRFMDQFVVPYVEDENQKKRMVDELPQAAQGKVIMTTEPKFIPQEAAKIHILDDIVISVRLIDCVGFLVDGAMGHEDELGERMVKTPWSQMEMPFSEAAAMGTEKVIRDHSTLAVMVTTDGSIGELPRENFVEAEKQTLKELNAIHKPYVVVLNCLRPNSEESQNLKQQMEEEYRVPVLPMNVEQMKKIDVEHILKSVLYEFPVTTIGFVIPKWTEMLDTENEIKKCIVKMANAILMKINKVKDVYQKMKSDEEDENCMKDIQLRTVNLLDGTVQFSLELQDDLYYQYISKLTGMPIDGEYQLMKTLKILAQQRSAYERVQSALEAVAEQGYGVVMPMRQEITMEEPVLINHGNKYGVKLKAQSPSVHMIKASIETEIAPIVGTKEQANDLIRYINENKESNTGVWNANIFGKSIGTLVEEGIQEKLENMDMDCKEKLQDTMQKIVNDYNGGMVCIII